MRRGLSESMMERLVRVLDPPVVQMLDTQYRMNQEIMAWPSRQFYGGRLKAAAGVAARTVTSLPGVERSPTTDHRLVLVNTCGKMGQMKSRDPAESSISNPSEAAMVVSSVKQLVKSGVLPAHIGVISFYALQVELIQQKLSSMKLLEGVEVNTVDGFQGQEKEVIILSMVRSNPQKSIGFLKEHRRLNVAVTRARRMLVVIGDRNTFRADKVYNSFFSHMENCAAVINIKTNK